MMDVLISGRCPQGISETVIRDALLGALRGAKRSAHGSVSLACISDAKMKLLNRKWRKKNKSTDVLSFASDPIPGVADTKKHWGDIFISPTYVRAQARERRISTHEEFLRVAIHGMLHLMGYDHATEREEKEMFGIQERVLKRVCSRL